MKTQLSICLAARKRLVLEFLFALSVAIFVGGFAETAAVGESECGTNDAAHICDVVSAEDLVRLPGSDYVLASSYHVTGGPPSKGLYLIHATERKPIEATWTAGTVSGSFDCPGPLERGKLSSHGVAIRDTGAGSPTAYVINHVREGVEVFNIDSSQSPPILKWIGCILAPDNMDLNSVAPLPDGGIVASVLSERGDPDVNKKIFAGQPTGFILEWLPKKADGTGYPALRRQQITESKCRKTENISMSLLGLAAK
ncbi:hypothetical protein IF803_37140 [Bradyrhizobium sp. UFLA06-06]